MPHTFSPLLPFAPTSELTLKLKLSLLFTPQPHNSAFIGLGTLLLWFGWFGFNSGSTLALSGKFILLAEKVAVGTTLAASGGGIAAICMCFIKDGCVSTHSFYCLTTPAAFCLSSLSMNEVRGPGRTREKRPNDGKIKDRKEKKAEN